MGKFLILFIIITISEVYLMKIVAEKTGFLFLLGFVMFTGFLGITLAKVQGRVHLQKIQKDLGEGKLPENPVIEGLMILVAALSLSFSLTHPHTSLQKKKGACIYHHKQVELEYPNLPGLGLKG